MGSTKSKKSVYIDRELFNFCVELIEKNNPSLLKTFRQDKRGWESKLINYVLNKLIDECVKSK